MAKILFITFVLLQFWLSEHNGKFAMRVPAIFTHPNTSLPLIFQPIQLSPRRVHSVRLGSLSPQQKDIPWMPWPPPPIEQLPPSEFRIHNIHGVAKKHAAIFSNFFPSAAVVDYIKMHFGQKRFRDETSPSLCQNQSQNKASSGTRQKLQIYNGPGHGEMAPVGSPWIRTYHLLLPSSSAPLFLSLPFRIICMREPHNRLPFQWPLPPRNLTRRKSSKCKTWEL